MELSRLKELTTISQGETIAEAKNTHEASMDGIEAIVADALGDLSDKLGKGGSLEQVMRDSGAAKLDKIKDADGQTILSRITIRTEQYRKEIEKLIVEANLLVSQVSEGLIVEAANEYDDSADFTDEFYTITGDVAKMQKAMKNPRWMGWMKSTDSNYGTDCEPSGRAAIKAVNDLQAALSDIDDELDKADS